MIVVNCRFLTQKVTGVQRFALELVKRFSKYMNQEMVFVAPRAATGQDVKFLDDIKVRTIGRFRGNLWEQVDLPVFLAKQNSPLLVNLVGIGPIFYKNKIIALYDLAFVHHPEWFSFFFRSAYNVLIPLSIKNSQKIITDSQYVSKDIQQEYGISQDKIHVVYAAASSIFIKKDIPRENIILTVSSIDPRKNLARIIEAFSSIETDYQLVIVGAKNKSFSEIKFEKHILDNSRIKFTGYIGDDELINLYNKAKIFVYASLFEGFGIPPMEAQSCGLPCLISNVTALPEIYGDSAAYCDPYSTESISRELSKLILDSEYQEALRIKGLENVKRYSWDNAAREFINSLKNYEL